MTLLNVELKFLNGLTDRSNIIDVFRAIKDICY